MARNNKVRIDRIIIIVLVCLLVLGALGFGVYKLFGLFFTDDNENTIIPQTEVNTTDGVNISLVDYTVYEDDTNSLGFNFVVAKLRFTAEDKFSFDLGNLQTSEKLYLNKVTSYLQILQEKGYKINELELSSSIVSETNALEANVFVPYTTEIDSLSIYNTNNPKTNINFDLDENTVYITTLKFKTEDNIKVDDTSVRVSSSFVSTMMKHNGEEYEIPSSVSVFTFIIYVDETKDNVSITDAYFIKDGDTEDDKIKCLSDEYKSVKVENIIGKKLVQGENGALFFETYTKGNELSYDGILMLKFSNSNDWIKVSTTLQ